jgi:hypothetical protein
VLEGKLDLKSYNWDAALGQCMHRVTAILEAQPWRDFVIIPYFCLTETAFLRVVWEGHNRIFGYPHPTHTVKMECLMTDSNAIVASDGFCSLAAMLATLTLFGCTPCPV